MEYDSKLVVLEFTKPSKVPWILSNRWENALHYTRSIWFIATFIFREGNHCKDRLANIGLHVYDFNWWDVIHIDILNGIFSKLYWASLLYNFSSRAFSLVPSIFYLYNKKKFFNIFCGGNRPPFSNKKIYKKRIHNLPFYQLVTNRLSNVLFEF